MAQLFRRIVIAGGTVAVLGLAAIGTGSLIGAADRAPAPSSTADVASAADALLAADTSTPASGGALDATRLRRLAAWRHLVHATATLDLPALGGLTTIQLDHGTIQAVTPSSLTIAETGGTTVTVDLGADTKVRKDAAKVAVGDLAAGDEVFAMSRVEAGGSEAYLVVVPKG